ncbi:Lrp/AsnC family transcriptional regulator [Herpetosiphon geysericola]|uniref:HTH asnC-type domain-containing protein n=1 Tax=Herpetosiphon geysericola TaxID=70996 RepID=A0A0P6XT98_9CHLR|nr:Lrp/AsnC family transcriptional regulator [Herpetosiphon geysericola]KPL82262.1 hypothetical protein SE18_19760 [Herpetosiphon geysericola]
MTSDTERLLDATGWQILVALQSDARISYSELGQHVGLIAPAVRERIRKFEEAGIITGYHATVNRRLVGLPVSAIIRMGLHASESSAATIAALDSIEEVLECARVMGTDTLILKVGATSIEHLEKLIDRLLVYGPLTSAMVLSTPIERRNVTQAITMQAQTEA